MNELKAFRVTKRSACLAQLQEFAFNKGGRLVSSIYRGDKPKLIWECSEQHQWSAKWGHVKNGSWCPFCAGNVRNRIQIMQEHAREKGGTLLSTTYINAHTPLLWRCAEGHEWSISWHNLRKGAWCPKFQYAQEHGVTLFIIPYTAFNDLPSFIDNLVTEYKYAQST